MSGKRIKPHHMLTKILIMLIAFAGNFGVQWYGNFTGKLATKGTYLGIHYDSIFVRAIVTQFEYLWVLILINILFTLVFGLGFATFKNYLSLAVIWIGMAPIAALVFNTFVLKQSVNYIAVIGVILLIAGGVMIVAQKDILALISR